MKKLILIGLLSAISLANSSAVTISTNLAANLTRSLFTNFAAINSIVIENTNATTVASFYLFASPSSNTFYSIGAYSNVSRTIGTITNIYTNVLSVIQTNTYPGIILSTNSVAASTNNYPLIYQANVNSNSTVTYEPPFPIYTANGFTSTNSARVTVTINYTQ